MKYLITENQFKKLQEQMMTLKGSMDFNPIYSSINKLEGQLGQNALRDLAVEYLTSVVGMTESEIKKILGSENNLDKLEKRLDLITGFIYYVGVNNSEMVSVSPSLSYFTLPFWGWDRFYVDPEIESYVGFLSLYRNKYVSKIDLKEYSCAKINGIQIIDPFKSSGYGKQIYVSLLDEFEVVKSDDQLFTDSLNIWVNVLPKYAYVWLVDEFGKTKRISSKGKLPIYENYEYFIASKKDIYPV
jgi:hypothetical protein